MAILICKNCGKEFKTYRLTDHGRKRKFCTWDCAMKAKWNTTDKMGDKNISKRLDVRKKMSKARLGRFKNKNNYKWKGDSVGYYALHTWINNNWGKPTKCEFCGKTSGRLHWANKDGKYLRSKRDSWIQLCPSCHVKFDFTEKWRENLRKSHLGYVMPKEQKTKISKSIKKHYRDKRK